MPNATSSKKRQITCPNCSHVNEVDDFLMTNERQICENCWLSLNYVGLTKHLNSFRFKVITNSIMFFKSSFALILSLILVVVVYSLIVLSTVNIVLRDEKPVNDIAMPSKSKDYSLDDIIAKYSPDKAVLAVKDEPVVLDDTVPEEVAVSSIETASKPRGYNFDHIYTAEKPEYPVVAMPTNGKASYFTNKEAIAPFEVKVSKDAYYYVKLVNRSDSITIFVHKGMSIELDVPVGNYEMRYASGEIWYGEKHHFGPNTSYNKADKRIEFKILGNQIQGNSVYLYKVTDGNLTTSAIVKEQF